VRIYAPSDRDLYRRGGNVATEFIIRR
jgi:hypothetical protein